jgi:hypothetical protein
MFVLSINQNHTTMKTELKKGGAILLNYNVCINTEGKCIYEGRAQYVSYFDSSIHNFFHFNTLVCKDYNDFIDTVKETLLCYFEGTEYVIDFGFITIDDYNINYKGS